MRLIKEITAIFKYPPTPNQVSKIEKKKKERKTFTYLS